MWTKLVWQVLLLQAAKFSFASCHLSDTFKCLRVPNVGDLLVLPWAPAMPCAPCLCLAPQRSALLAQVGWSCGDEAEAGVRWIGAHLPVLSPARVCRRRAGNLALLGKPVLVPQGVLLQNRARLSVSYSTPCIRCSWCSGQLAETCLGDTLRWYPLLVHRASLSPYCWEVSAAWGTAEKWKKHQNGSSGEWVSFW